MKAPRWNLPRGPLLSLVIESPASLALIQHKYRKSQAQWPIFGLGFPIQKHIYETLHRYHPYTLPLLSDILELEMLVASTACLPRLCNPHNRLTPNEPASLLNNNRLLPSLRLIP